MSIEAEERIKALEQELANVRRTHIAHLRDIAAAAGRREAHAVSLIASQKSQGKGVDTDEPHGGPGSSPGSNAANDKGSSAPPTGADPSPPAGKLDRCGPRMPSGGKMFMLKILWYIFVLVTKPFFSSLRYDPGIVCVCQHKQ
jgi:hypothetical protein